MRIFVSALNIPGTQMTSIFEGQPSKTRTFPTETRVIWVPGMGKTAPIHVLFFRKNPWGSHIFFDGRKRENDRRFVVSPFIFFGVNSPSLPESTP